MKNLHRKITTRSARLGVFLLLIVALLAAITFRDGTKVEANHPVLVEGNCDSPTPGTTTLPTTPGVLGASSPANTSLGICGDWDGDGRIGTAEDFDGADRIFGTLRGALGTGEGAAAGTGAIHNGTIIIVESGRFAETLYIGDSGFVPGEGVASPGNVTIEAAPGVAAVIDAILQDDSAGGNNTRSGQTGIQILYTSTDRVVILRNLTIRNFFTGIAASQNSRVIIDGCRLENNIGYGIRAQNNSRVVVSNSQVASSGFRIGSPVTTPSPGNGISVENNAQAKLNFTNISHNATAGINNSTGNAANALLYEVSTYFNTPNIIGGFTVSPNPNYSF